MSLGVRCDAVSGVYPDFLNVDVRCPREEIKERSGEHDESQRCCLDVKYDGNMWCSFILVYHDVSPRASWESSCRYQTTLSD